MAETPRGIVYPESTADTRLWIHYQNLAETTDQAIDDAAGDSGWVTVPFRSGWKATSGGAPLAVRKIGQIVFLRGRVTNTAGSISPSTGNIVGTVPSGYRPADYEIAFASVSQNAGATPSRAFVTTAGEVAFDVYTGATPYVILNCSYLTA